MEAVSVTKKLGRGKNMAKKLTECGISARLQALFGITIDERTGYLVSDPSADVFWEELVPIIRDFESWSFKCVAWDRIKEAMRNDPEAMSEIGKAERRRLRDDFKTALLLGYNYTLNQKVLACLVRALGLDDGPDLENTPVSKLLKFFPENLWLHLDELTYQLRSIIVNIGPYLKKKGKKKSTGPRQQSLAIKSRRIAAVPGQGYLLLLKTEKVLTARQIKKLAALIPAFNGPRVEQIEGTEAGNIKTTNTENPVIQFIQARRELLEKKTKQHRVARRGKTNPNQLTLPR